MRTGNHAERTRIRSRAKRGAVTAAFVGSLLLIVLPATGLSAAGHDPGTNPAGGPTVIETDEEITILFPPNSGIILSRRPGLGISGIRQLFTGDRVILSAPPGEPLPPPSLVMVSGDSVGGIADWPGYLLDREAAGGRWPSTGHRVPTRVGLDTAEYLGYAITGDNVTLSTRVGDAGTVDWIFAPAAPMPGAPAYAGLGWKIRLDGPESAAMMRIVEPAAPVDGDWAFAQTWGNFVEGRFGSPEPFAPPTSWYFGDTQPFYFSGGADGTTLSFFDSPVCARVGVTECSGRERVESQIPLGEGPIRETPMKFWMWSAAPLATKWEALDEWTALFDVLADRYRDQLGLGTTGLLPALEMRFPDEAYMADYTAYGPPPVEESWLVRYADTELPLAAELGFRVIRVVVWESDAEHPFAEYLPGSQCGGSGNAPWRLDVSEALGGEPALRVLTDRAHELGVRIVLWNSPGHLSNSSPLLVEHPEWVMWRGDGRPQDAGYGDVTGMSLRSGYHDYALARYGDVVPVTGVDGFMVDSHLTFGIMTDFARPQPTPQLDRTLETQRAWWDMGVSDIILEGCGPLGLSSGGLPGYDAFEPEVPPELRREARSMLMRMRGREYGWYRYIVDTLVEPESYYRALASKGQISPQFLDVLLRHPGGQVDRIARANHDYLCVMDRMGHRRLVADGDAWQGVEWTQDGSSDVVLFAFDTFVEPVDGAVIVQDVTAGTEFEATGSFETEPTHTYIIPGRARAPHPPNPA